MAEEAPDVATLAARLAAEAIIVDTHIDVPYRLVEEMEDISQATEKGDFDYPRALAGGLDAAFMSVYIPARHQESGDARQVAEELIEMVEGFERDSPDKFAVARSVADVRAHKEAGLISLPMGLENGAPIDSLEDVRYFAERGIRYVTLTHSKDNQICDSSYVDPEERTWQGLSPFGREVVAEMNRQGVMIDVSHISDDAFWQVMELTTAPVIASHSSCRAFTPGWERNIDDEMIRKVGENGGVVMINFGSAFLTEASQKQSRQFWEAFGAFIEESGESRSSEAAQEFRRSWFEENGAQIYAEMSDVVAHIDHVVELAGIDHVGIGSDYDGVGDSLPEGLKDVSGYPNLVAALLEAGYSEAEVTKILGENLLRVWSEVERVAAES
ncbi:MAG: dipeptidase [Thermoanaerobaculia bacterium]